MDELTGTKDNNKLVQIACLEYLLNEFCYGDPERYITASEIESWLKDSGRFLEATTDIVTESVGRMRNKGVLISSRSNKPAGYKLPYSEQYLFDFVEHMNSKIMPMIKKVKICRDRVNNATGFNLDILKVNKFADLKEIISNL